MRRTQPSPPRWRCWWARCCCLPTEIIWAIRQRNKRQHSNETLRVSDSSPAGENRGIQKTARRRVAGRFENDQAVPHSELLHLPAPARRRKFLSLQLL